MNKLPTIDIKGKEYVMVKDRVAYFNETYENGSIQTELISNDDAGVVFKATVIPDVSQPARKFTGYSEALSSANGTEGDKPVEVAETSAIGRAMAAMGIGIIESYASGDEVVVAEKNARPRTATKPTGRGYAT